MKIMFKIHAGSVNACDVTQHELLIQTLRVNACDVIVVYE